MFVRLKLFKRKWKLLSRNNPEKIWSKMCVALQHNFTDNTVVCVLQCSSCRKDAGLMHVASLALCFHYPSNCTKPKCRNKRLVMETLHILENLSNISKRLLSSAEVVFQMNVWRGKSQNCNGNTFFTFTRRLVVEIRWSHDQSTSRESRGSCLDRRGDGIFCMRNQRKKRI